MAPFNGAGNVFYFPKHQPDALLFRFYILALAGQAKIVKMPVKIIIHCRFGLFRQFFHESGLCFYRVSRVFQFFIINYQKFNGKIMRRREVNAPFRRHLPGFIAVKTQNQFIRQPPQNQQMVSGQSRSRSCRHIFYPVLPHHQKIHLPLHQHCQTRFTNIVFSPVKTVKNF